MLKMKIVFLATIYPISFKFCTRPYTAEVSDSHMQNTQKFNTADNSQFECYWISSSPLKYQPIWMTFLVREPCDQNSKFLKFNCGLLPYWKYFLDKNSALDCLSLNCNTITQLVIDLIVIG